MNLRKNIWLTGVVSAVSMIYAWSLWGAEPSRPASVRLAADAAPADLGDKPADAEAALRQLDVQAAELSLRLYELDLQKMSDINKQMAGLYSSAVVDRFRANVEMARQRVKASRERADGKRSEAIVGVGQTLLQAAEDAYERDLRANRQLASAIKPVDVERDRVSVEMAKVNLAKAKLIDQVDSPIAVVNWELDVLRDEVRQLRWLITAITSRR